MKKILIVALLLVTFISFTAPVGANSNENSLNGLHLGKLIIIDDNDSIIEELENRKYLDETLSIMKDYDFEHKKPKENLDIDIKSENETLVVNADSLNNKGLKQKVKNKIENGYNVYIYNLDLTEKEIYDFLDLKYEVIDDPKANEIEKVNNDTKYNIIGFSQSEVNYLGKVSAITFDGKPKDITSDIFIQNIMIHRDKKINDEKNIVNAFDYGTDTIVDSEYGLYDSFYADDAYGNSILRADLYADLIMKRNITQDQDPYYDYFYIRENIEFTNHNPGGTYLYKLIPTHDLPFTSDELLDFGPEQTTNVNNYSIQVGLPWSVSWSFNPGDGSVDIDTIGGSSTDVITWELFNESFLGFDYPIPDETRMEPGTAWASTGTYAGINVNTTGEFKYGANNYTLNISHNMRYDY